MDTFDVLRGNGDLRNIRPQEAKLFLPALLQNTEYCQENPDWFDTLCEGNLDADTFVAYQAIDLQKILTKAQDDLVAVPNSQDNGHFDKDEVDTMEMDDEDDEVQFDCNVDDDDMGVLDDVPTEASLTHNQDSGVAVDEREASACWWDEEDEESQAVWGEDGEQAPGLPTAAAARDTLVLEFQAASKERRAELVVRELRTLMQTPHCTTTAAATRATTVSSEVEERSEEERCTLRTSSPSTSPSSSSQLPSPLFECAACLPELLLILPCILNHSPTLFHPVAVARALLRCSLAPALLASLVANLPHHFHPLINTLLQALQPPPPHPSPSSSPSLDPHHPLPPPPHTISSSTLPDSVVVPLVPPSSTSSHPPPAASRPQSEGGVSAAFEDRSEAAAPSATYSIMSLDEGATSVQSIQSQAAKRALAEICRQLSSAAPHIRDQLRARRLAPDLAVDITLQYCTDALHFTSACIFSTQDCHPTPRPSPTNTNINVNNTINNNSSYTNSTSTSSSSFLYTSGWLTAASTPSTRSWLLEALLDASPQGQAPAPPGPAAAELAARLEGRLLEEAKEALVKAGGLRGRCLGHLRVYLWLVSARVAPCSRHSVEFWLSTLAAIPRLTSHTLTLSAALMLLLAESGLLVAERGLQPLVLHLAHRTLIDFASGYPSPGVVPPEVPALCVWLRAQLVVGGAQALHNLQGLVGEAMGLQGDHSALLDPSAPLALAHLLRQGPPPMPSTPPYPDAIPSILHPDSVCTSLAQCRPSMGLSARSPASDVVAVVVGSLSTLLGAGVLQAVGADVLSVVETLMWRSEEPPHPALQGVLHLYAGAAATLMQRELPLREFHHTSEATPTTTTTAALTPTHPLPNGADSTISTALSDPGSAAALPAPSSTPAPQHPSTTIPVGGGAVTAAVAVRSSPSQASPRRGQLVLVPSVKGVPESALKGALLRVGGEYSPKLGKNGVGLQAVLASYYILCHMEVRRGGGSGLEGQRGVVEDEDEEWELLLSSIPVTPLVTYMRKSDGYTSLFPHWMSLACWLVPELCQGDMLLTPPSVPTFSLLLPHHHAPPPPPSPTTTITTSPAATLQHQTNLPGPRKGEETLKAGGVPSEELRRRLRSSLKDPLWTAMYLEARTPTPQAGDSDSVLPGSRQRHSASHTSVSLMMVGGGGSGGGGGGDGDGGGDGENGSSVLVSMEGPLGAKRCGSEVPVKGGGDGDAEQKEEEEQVVVVAELGPLLLDLGCERRLQVEFGRWWQALAPGRRGALLPLLLTALSGDQPNLSSHHTTLYSQEEALPPPDAVISMDTTEGRGGAAAAAEGTQTATLDERGSTSFPSSSSMWSSGREQAGGDGGSRPLPSWGELQCSPLTLMQVASERVWRVAPLCSLLLGELGRLLGANTRRLSQPHQQVVRSDEVGAAVLAQKCAAVQLLLQTCLPTLGGTHHHQQHQGHDGPAAAAGELVECRSLVFAFLSEMFLQDNTLLTCVHFQGYPLPLVAPAVAAIPCLHHLSRHLPDMQERAEAQEATSAGGGAVGLFPHVLAAELAAAYPMQGTLALAQRALRAALKVCETGAAAGGGAFLREGQWLVQALGRAACSLPALLPGVIRLLHHCTACEPEHLRCAAKSAFDELLQKRMLVGHLEASLNDP